MLCASAVALAAACLPELGALPAEPDVPAGDAGADKCGDGLIASLDDGGGETCDPGDASPPGCERCRVTCAGGRLDPVTHHCYFGVGPRASFQEAFQKCRSEGAHVVTIDGEREARLVAELVPADARYWIGLSYEAALGAYGARGSGVDPGFEPGWPEPLRGTGPCRGCFGLGLDGGGFAPLDDGGADGGSASSLACVASAGGAWLGVPCAGASTAFETVCEREPRGQRGQSCGGALCFTLPSTAATKSYVLVPVLETAEQAERTCADYPGGRLVVLGSPEEREELVRELATAQPLELLLDVRSYWLGAARSDGGGWSWADGRDESALAVPWSDKQPAASGARAYLQIAAEKYDTGLVSVETNPAVTRAYVCERVR